MLSHLTTEQFPLVTHVTQPKAILTPAGRQLPHPVRAEQPCQAGPGLSTMLLAHSRSTEQVTAMKLHFFCL